MKNLSVKKLALAGMLCALAVVGSVFSFPIFGSKCAPVQHMVNILCAVLLGPYWGLGGLCAYPVAILLMGKSAGDIAFYAYIVPFLVSTAGGAVIAGVLLAALQRSGALHSMQTSLS